MGTQRYEDSCEYSDYIHASATDEFLAFLKSHNISFEAAKEALQKASHAHNREETPNFAKSIERRALRQVSAVAKAVGR